jgi:formylmethanofuran dehydrogenase subunit D
MESSGGGGYGDSLERDLEMVEEDLREGLVTKARAKTRYGVVLEGDEVDREKTDRQRERMRKERFYFGVRASREDEYRGTKRLCFLSPGAMKNLDLKEGDLVEIVNPGAAPLRAWVSGVEGEDEGAVYLGKSGLEILGVREGDRIEVRQVKI